MRYLSIVLGVTTAFVAGTGVAQEKGEVKVEVVKYEGLKDAVLRNRGKVTLVDFWGVT
jgi:hypothetical protein